MQCSLFVILITLVGSYFENQLNKFVFLIWSRNMDTHNARNLSQWDLLTILSGFKLGIVFKILDN